MTDNNNNNTKMVSVLSLKNKFYSGTENVLNKCLEIAQSLDNKFIVAYDYPYSYQDGHPQDDDTLVEKITKVYSHYKTYNHFKKDIKGVLDSNELCFYEVITKNTQCCLYADLEWTAGFKTIQEVKDFILSLCISLLNKLGINDITTEHFYFLNASKNTKCSLHLHSPYISFSNTDEQKYFWNEIFKQIPNDDTWFFMEKTNEKTMIKKTVFDTGVYNNNRQMRLVNNCKRSDKTLKGERPLLSSNEHIDDYDFNDLDYLITHNTYKLEHKVNVSSLSTDVIMTKRHNWKKDFVQQILDSYNIEASVSSFNTNEKLIKLKNKTKNRVCIIGGEDNKTDQSYCFIGGKHGDKLYYGCHDDGCKGKHKLIHTIIDEKEKLEDDIPFKQFIKNFNKIPTTENKRTGVPNQDTEKYMQWLDDTINIMNNYVVFITHKPKSYCLVRTLHMFDENSDLEKNKKMFAWKPTHSSDLKDTYNNFCVFLNGKEKPIIDLWLKSPNRATYIGEDYDPFMSNEKKKYYFNSFEKIGITKNEAKLKCNPNQDYLNIIINFIKENLCNDDNDCFDYVIKWMSHLIQKPSIKMHTCLVLRGNQGIGKGSIVQILAKILGSHNTFQPTDVTDVFGSFNYLLDNKFLLFMDEMFWGGDLKHSGILKKLITENTRTSNCKNVPQRTVSNRFNVIMASNGQWVIPADEGSRRFTCLDVKDSMRKMTKEQKKQIYDFCPYTFAHYLYNIDISNFDPNTPYITEALKEQKILSMNPIDDWLINMINEKVFYDEETEEPKYMSKSSLFSKFQKERKCPYINDTKFWMHIRKLIPEQQLDLKRMRLEDDFIIGMKTLQYCVRFPSRLMFMSFLETKYGCSLLVDVAEELHLIPVGANE